MYAYAGSSPFIHTDDDGRVIDTAADVAFVIYDLWRLWQDGSCNRIENLTALGLDVAAVLVPGVTGLGAASRGAHIAADGAHTVFRVDKTKGRISHYETFVPQKNPKNPNPWSSEKRFDGQGPPHFNKATGSDVPTPHVHDPSVPGGVRLPRPDELPKGY